MEYSNDPHRHSCGTVTREIWTQPVGLGENTGREEYKQADVDEKN